MPLNLYLTDMSDVSGTKNATGEKLLNKAERKQCWDARDAFWNCMKSNGEEISKCADLRQGFEEFCPNTWVVHFDRRYDYLKFKENATKHGYKKLDDEFVKK